jgi:hypothetical protein
MEKPVYMAASARIKFGARSAGPRTCFGLCNQTLDSDLSVGSSLVQARDEMHVTRQTLDPSQNTPTPRRLPR